MTGDDTPPRDRGVSPVVGTVFMIAVAVALAAVVGGTVVGFDEKLKGAAPMGSFDTTYYADGEDNTDDRPYVEITHRFGETMDGGAVVISDEAGNSITWEDVWTGGPVIKNGEHVHIDGFGSDSVLEPICEEGDTYNVVYKPGDGSSSVVTTWSAPRPPNLPAGSDSDDDGDGIPNWC